MLAHASHVVILDLFSWSVAALKNEIEAAAERGLTVAVKVYEPCRLKKVDVILDVRAEHIQKRWPGQWANGERALADGKGTRSLRAILNSTRRYMADDAPGYRLLKAQLGDRSDIDS